jgi:phage terminase Nu1 subunit (DNA packaging protein)
MGLVAQKMTDCRPCDTPEAKGQKGRSKVTNGRVLIAGVDQRSPWVRRCKDILREHLSDTPDASAAERSILRRAAVLTTELEQLETQFALAGHADAGQLETYQRCANTLRRLLEAVAGGLQRRAKDVSPPTLDEIALEIEAEKRSPTRAAAPNQLAEPLTTRGRSQDKK